MSKTNTGTPGRRTEPPQASSSSVAEAFCSVGRLHARDNVPIIGSGPRGLLSVGRRSMIAIGSAARSWGGSSPLVYNWWTIFMRLGIPDKHAEVITSRPLALHGIARQTRHGNQTTVEITSTHSKAAQIAEILTKVSGSFLGSSDWSSSAPRIRLR